MSFVCARFVSVGYTSRAARWFPSNHLGERELSPGLLLSLWWIWLCVGTQATAGWP